MRTCVGCRTAHTADRLVRVRWQSDGLLTGPGPGRGAWLCAAHPVTCLDQAGRRGALMRALRLRLDGETAREAMARLRATLGDQQTDQTNQTTN